MEMLIKNTNRKTIYSPPPPSSCGFQPSLLSNHLSSRIDNVAGNGVSKGINTAAWDVVALRENRGFSFWLGKYLIWTNLISHAWGMCWPWISHSGVEAAGGWLPGESKAFMRGRGEDMLRKWQCVCLLPGKPEVTVEGWELVNVPF